MIEISDKQKNISRRRLDLRKRTLRRILYNTLSLLKPARHTEYTQCPSIMRVKMLYSVEYPFKVHISYPFKQLYVDLLR